MPKRKRPVRSRHPGVVIKERKLPSGATTYRARFTDPDTGREVYVTLDGELGLTTAEARTLWAKRKAQTLAERRAALAAGAPTKTKTTVDDAITGFFSAQSHLRQRTLETYRQRVELFRTWMKGRGMAHVEAITPMLLAELRTVIVAGGKQVVQKGKRRGAREQAAAKRAAPTVNSYLTSTKILLNHLRALGRLPMLSKDVISDTLKPLPMPREQAEYLTAVKIAKLLDAAQRHDAAVFDETRDEHAGLRVRGTTRRYEPIASFAAFLLLTGCRRGEALGLTWADVDLDALDAQARVVGEIRLGATRTKTHRARTIGLEVSPALRTLLASMKLQAGRDAEKQHVFGGAPGYTADLVESARARMIDEYGAPRFDWQMLRSTCATYLTNSPGIFVAATVFLSARQLGHSVAVAERHYLGVHRGIPKDAHTLEAAMQIEPQMCELVRGTSARELAGGVVSLRAGA